MGPLQTQRLTTGLYNGVFPKGVLIELSGAIGSGRTSVVLEFLQKNTSFRAAWIESNCSLFAPCLWQKQIDPERILMIESVTDFLKNMPWIAAQVLQSKVFECMIINLNTQNQNSPQFETLLRRLQILAKKSQSYVFLLSPHPTTQARWPIQVQIQFPEFTVIKCPPSFC